ncbi:RloB family protein [Merdimonas faecis]|uniref:RloB family protein n=1 Tax=Merdimonas faecis TaxID=1653435 RepID=UPI0023F6A7EA|nr:RloB family protein [Merdimonas faecis]
MANRSGGKSSDRRAGKRKDRNQRVGTRVPELGYYLIVTDTKETEKNYFDGLRDSIPTELKDRLVIKVEKARTADLVKRALELANKEPQYRIPWIVFDRDQVTDFDNIIQLAEKSGVGAGWSNPCFEIWMYAYFGEMPTIGESYTCCDRFADKFEKVTGQKYLKRDKDIYRKLMQFGDEKKAIQIAERCYRKCVNDGKIKPSEMWPACTVQRLVEEICKKTRYC